MDQVLATADDATAHTWRERLPLLIPSPDDDGALYSHRIEALAAAKAAKAAAKGKGTREKAAAEARVAELERLAQPFIRGGAFYMGFNSGTAEAAEKWRKHCQMALRKHRSGE